MEMAGTSRLAPQDHTRIYVFQSSSQRCLFNCLTVLCDILCIIVHDNHQSCCPVQDILSYFMALNSIYFSNIHP